MDIWHFVVFFWGICFANFVLGIWKLIRHRGSTIIVLTLSSNDLRERFRNMIKRTDCRNEADVVRMAVAFYDAIVGEQTIGGEPYIHYPDGSVVKVSLDGRVTAKSDE